MEALPLHPAAEAALSRGKRQRGVKRRERTVKWRGGEKSRGESMDISTNCIPKPFEMENYREILGDLFWFTMICFGTRLKLDTPMVPHI